MTYKEARVYLDEMSKYGSVLGLDTVRELLRELGNPQESLQFIHIAGTNGKGSVLAYISTVLSEAGYKTGRYVSPTVVSYLERIQVDGIRIGEESFARLTGMVKKAIARMEAAGRAVPTVFEIETAIAFLYFKEQQCDLVVLECGLGGALDATNIVRNTLCAVFSSISRDHIGILGGTLAEIAQEKAGIIKSGCTVITAPQKPEVFQILKARAESLLCPIVSADQSLVSIQKDDYTGQQFSYKKISVLNCPLAGRHQTDNAVAALETLWTLQSLGYSIDERALREGFKKTTWPGRFTCVKKRPLFFVDGAHNEDAARRLRESVKRYFPKKQPILIMGVFQDKEYEKIAALMGPLAKLVYTLPLPDRARSLPPEELAAVMKRFCPEGTPILVSKSVEDAVRGALNRANPDKDMILAFGSLSFLGQVIELMRNTKEGGLSW